MFLLFNMYIFFFFGFILAHHRGFVMAFYFIYYFIL